MTTQTITLTVTIREPLRHRIPDYPLPGVEVMPIEIARMVQMGASVALKNFYGKAEVKLEEPE